MLDRVVDRPVPDEAEIAVARPHRNSRHREGTAPGAVNVQLLLTETVGETAAVLDELRTHGVAEEGVRALPVGDGDDAVVERGYWIASAPSRCRASARKSESIVTLWLGPSARVFGPSEVWSET